jgi:hypothetical protein
MTAMKAGIAARQYAPTPHAGFVRNAQFVITSFFSEIL